MNFKVGQTVTSGFERRQVAPLLREPTGRHVTGKPLPRSSDCSTAVIVMVMTLLFRFPRPSARKSAEKEKSGLEDLLPWMAPFSRDGPAFA